MYLSQTNGSLYILVYFTIYCKQTILIDFSRFKNNLTYFKTCMFSLKYLRIKDHNFENVKPNNVSPKQRTYIVRHMMRVMVVYNS